MAKSNRKSKASAKSAKAKRKKVESGPDASKEFGGENYGSDDWKKLKKKHPGGFQTILLDLKKKEWDDETHSWFAVLEGHDKRAKINEKSGQALREAFGKPMNDWKGRTVHVLPTEYNVGWGAVIAPVIEDDTDEEALGDEDLDLDDENVD